MMRFFFETCNGSSRIRLCFYTITMNIRGERIYQFRDLSLPLPLRHTCGLADAGRPMTGGN